MGQEKRLTSRDSKKARVVVHCLAYYSRVRNIQIYSSHTYHKLINRYNCNYITCAQYFATSKAFGVACRRLVFVQDVGTKGHWSIWLVVCCTPQSREVSSVLKPHLFKLSRDRPTPDSNLFKAFHTSQFSLCPGGSSSASGIHP